MSRFTSGQQLSHAPGNAAAQAGLWHIAVIIPARNEELLLPRCLASVQRARKALPFGVTSDLIVVADCSDDRTEEIAAAMLAEGGDGTVIHSDAGAVGVARALGVRLALHRYLEGRFSQTGQAFERCWLANTDADCIVPEDWLALQLASAESGSAAVAGVVDVDSFEEHEQHVEQRFRLTYLLHADGTHTHVHGANFGIRADAYCGAGGWSNCETGEDHHLWRRLQRGAAPIVSSTRLRVVTSGRRVGRAPLGFADALAAHNGVRHGEIAR